MTLHWPEWSEEEWERRLARVQKFNPYHEPAGSPVGGRFASRFGMADPQDFGKGSIPGSQFALERRLEKETGVRSFQIYKGPETTFDAATSRALPSQVDRNTARAAVEIAEVLKTTAAIGLPLPTTVRVVSRGEGNGAGVTGTAGWGSLEISVPDRLPDDVSLDDAVKAYYGGIPGPGSSATRRYVSETFADVVVHELGHVLHGAKGNIAMERKVGPEHTRVSAYAGKNGAEFVAEVFAAHHRGEDISGPVESLYRQLEGYPLGWPRSKWKDYARYVP